MRIKIDISNKGVNYDLKGIDEYDGPPKQLADFLQVKVKEILQHIYEVNHPESEVSDE